MRSSRLRYATSATLARLRVGPGGSWSLQLFDQYGAVSRYDLTVEDAADQDEAVRLAEADLAAAYAVSRDDSPARPWALVSWSLRPAESGRALAS